MANQGLKKLNYQIGRICRIGSRKLKLMAVNNRRKQQLRHLGERIYILKTLQQDDNIWDKDEIAQLLLTIADLDQEIEMIIDEINEIKAETPPDDAPAAPEETSPAPETPAADDKPDAAESEDKPAAAPASPETPETKKVPETREAKETKEAKKPARKAETKASKKKPAAKSGQKSKATTKKSTTKSEKADK